MVSHLSGKIYYTGSKSRNTELQVKEQHSSLAETAVYTVMYWSPPVSERGE